MSAARQSAPGGSIAELDLPPIDSYFISTVITCGLPAALLFMWILFRATRMSWRISRQLQLRRSKSNVDETGEMDMEAMEVEWREARVWRIAAALMPVLMLNSFFGNTFTLYSVAPIGWLLVGWISAGTLRQTTEQIEL